MMTTHAPRRHLGALAAALLIVSQGGARVAAADLQPQTVRAFDAYSRALESRVHSELSGGRGFLASDFGDPREAAGIRRAIIDGGVPVVHLDTPGSGAQDLTVPDGLLNHWRGAILVPRVTLDQVLAELRSPQTRRHVQDDVLESRVLWRRGDESQVYLKLMRRKIVTVTYNTEHAVRFVRLGPTRACSQSVATRIAELEDAGTPAEHEKPIGQDRGFLWRLNSYWRYEQVPQGVIVELESLTLSRDLPSAVRIVVRPLIDAIARESITRTLESVRARLLADTAGRAPSVEGLR
jgi:hypothetical protein